MYLLTGKLLSDRNEIGHSHSIFSDRAGLVHAKCVDTGKGLDTFHLMNKNFLLSEFHCTDCKSGACQKK